MLWLDVEEWDAYEVHGYAMQDLELLSSMSEICCIAWSLRIVYMRDHQRRNAIVLT